MQAIIEILQNILDKTNNQTDFSETAYDSIEEIQEDLEIYIDLIENGDTACLDELSIHFLTNSTFYALAASNGFLEEYLPWQQTFDSIKKSL